MDPIKNLIPAKPGEPSRTLGRRLPAEVLQARQWRKDEIIEALGKYLVMTGPEIREALENKDNLRMVDRIVLACIQGAIDQKEIKRLELIFSYILGKPKEVVEHEINEIKIRIIRAGEQDKLEERNQEPGGPQAGAV